MLSCGRYAEISSCSNFEDFRCSEQGLNTKDAKNKSKFVHTLNGSSAAVGRIVSTILENYQNEDGFVTIPEDLIPFLGGKQR